MLTDGYADAFMVGSGIALLGLIATLMLIRGSDSRAHVELGAGAAAGREPWIAATLPRR